MNLAMTMTTVHVKLKLKVLAKTTLVRGVCRNFEKGLPLHLSDCYIRVVYLLDCSIRVPQSFH